MSETEQGESVDVSPAEPSFHEAALTAAREAAGLAEPEPAPEPEATESSKEPKVEPEATPEPESAEEAEPEPEKDKEPEPEKEEPAPEPRSKALAALARKERKLIEREAQLKAMEGKAAQYEAAIKSARENPIQLLEAAGLSVGDLTQYLVEGKAAPPKDADRISQLEARIENMQKARLEQEQAALSAQQQRLLADFQGQLTQHIKSSEKKYPLVHHNDAGGIVFQVIQQHAAQTGRILSNDEACLLVEKELSNIKPLPSGQANKATSPAGRVKSTRDGGSGPKDDQSTVPRTLSNDLTATASGKQDRELTDAEREANAIALLRRTAILQR